MLSPEKQKEVDTAWQQTCLNKVDRGAAVRFQKLAIQCWGEASATIDELRSVLEKKDLELRNRNVGKS